MPSIGEAVEKERRVTYLLWKAINSQLELEQATNRLMQDMYEDLENMRASDCSSEDWTTMCDMAQELVDTLKMLKDQPPDSTVEERSTELKVKEAIREDTEEEIEEDIEEYVEVLMKEMHPNLYQIRAAAGLEKDDMHDAFGLAKQMTKPHKFTRGEKEKKATIEKEKSSDAKKEVEE
ncbi:254c105f-25ab-4d88-90e0-40c987ef494e-CDS [Sclerotinia trifoliorum]|uniref:254c105f-25ab-4d88-90e0-40c987ef494e-CDS n=1 Tax=Sclerotinia trifoliorum TaxID=28548 RepID=A0A8H2ZUJ6_9HELO|nr:254c105f-25ab-4d88-90e0-40c987ef494e-CDS [Sclerotinia trifoliorum]